MGNSEWERLIKAFGGLIGRNYNKLAFFWGTSISLPGGAINLKGNWGLGLKEVPPFFIKFGFLEAIYQIKIFKKNFG